MKSLPIYCLILSTSCSLFTPSVQQDLPHPQQVGLESGPVINDTAQVIQTLDFKADIEPILKMRCQPCHFKGGKMYARLPFDTAATLYNLNERLFTRIKDPAEQALLREFLKRNE